VLPNAALAIAQEEEEERDGVGGEERSEIDQRKGFRYFPQRAQG